MINSLAKYVTAFEVDLVTLSGKPSELPQVKALLEDLLPVLPQRIVQAKHFPAGDWYPMSTDNRISDAKSVTAVGAALYQAIKNGLINGWSIQRQSSETCHPDELLGVDAHAQPALPVQPALPLARRGRARRCKMQIGAFIGRKLLPSAAKPEQVYRFRWRNAGRFTGAHHNSMLNVTLERVAPPVRVRRKACGSRKSTGQVARADDRAGRRGAETLHAGRRGVLDRQRAFRGELGMTDLEIATRFEGVASDLQALTERVAQLEARPVPAAEAALALPSMPSEYPRGTLEADRLEAEEVARQQAELLRLGDEIERERALLTKAQADNDEAWEKHEEAARQVAMESASWEVQRAVLREEAAALDRTRRVIVKIWPGFLLSEAFAPWKERLEAALLQDQTPAAPALLFANLHGYTACLLESDLKYLRDVLRDISRFLYAWLKEEGHSEHDACVLPRNGLPRSMANARANARSKFPSQARRRITSG